MTLYLGNNEVSQKVLLNQTVGSNLPAITPETSGKILSNNGSTLEWVDKPSGKIVGSFGYTIDEVAPDGCVFCDGGEYEKAKFPDFYQSLVDNKRKSVDYATFNSSVSTNGSCGFFGLDTENEKFKVPMLKDVYLKAGLEPVIFGGESLPNIKGTTAILPSNEFSGTNGAFYVDEALGAGDGTQTGTGNSLTGFDASRSSPTYQNEAKVNPDYVAYKVFVVIYNAETEISESQTSEFLNTINDINNKIDSSRTNCITKIPQDIKLELSEDGVLTLKAGSKVYIPNGFEEDSITKKFDNLIINTDISWGKLPELGNNSPIFIYINENNQDSHYRLISSCFSGNSDSEAGTTYYNTTTNIITAHNSTGDIHCSFPIGIIEKNNEGNLQINQVFNGFGYMGSTIFALPGIEGLIPNGYNDDGSLNNTKFTTTNVSIIPQVEVNRGIAFFIDGSNNINTWGSSGGNVLYFKTRPSVAPRTYCRAHIEDENRWIASADTTAWTETLSICHCGNLQSESTGKVTSFSPKNVFQAIDRNDTTWASLAGKPSNVIQKLTLEASGSEFTVPSNGWFFCNVTVTSDALNANYLALENKTSYISIKDVTIAQSLVLGHNLYIPCKSGDVIRVTYSGNLQGDNFTRFIYDIGSK